ncbi:MAG TPA: LD-carboxypeptidase [Gemmatimonadaceae bacterium]|jgi:muramoyltetrapeptide carboxypeptidase
MQLPSPLSAGARVALVAPAGPLRGEQELQAAITHATSLGWEPVVAKHALSRHGYLAGTDEERAADFNAALRDDDVDGIWCLRGGYGAMRILDALEYDAMRRHPRPLLGYSDITALHCAVNVCCGVVSYHAPTARGELTDFSRDSLVRAVVAQVDSCGSAPLARTLRDGRAAGRLVGGNLALLAALAGTPYAPDYTGAILVLEDVGEANYRIDRMLQQLRLSGAFDRLAGIAVGQFTEGADETETESCSLDEILRDVAAAARVPALAGIPLGHIADQWTIPIGARAELDAGARTLHVVPS